MFLYGVERHNYTLAQIVQEKSVNFVTQMFQNWNQIRASLEQLQSIFQHEASPFSTLTTTNY